MAIDEQLNRAAGEYVELIAEGLGKGRAVDSETAIAASARVAGALLLRSFNLDLKGMPTGAVVLSNEANDNFPQLASLAMSFLAGKGIVIDQSKLGGEQHQRGNVPQLDTVETLTRFLPKAEAIASSARLNLRQAADAAALATAFIVAETGRQIGYETALNVAVFGFIEGSKTVPPSGAVSNRADRKPWYRLW